MSRDIRRELSCGNPGSYDMVANERAIQRAAQERKEAAERERKRQAEQMAEAYRLIAGGGIVSCIVDSAGGETG